MSEINLSKKEILDRIGYFRNLRKMSAYRLSKELGDSKTYFYRVESGEIQLTLEMFLDVLEILNVSTSEFFCPTQKEDDKTLLNLINSLSSDSKQTILDLMKKLK